MAGFIEVETAAGVDLYKPPKQAADILAGPQVGWGLRVKGSRLKLVGQDTVEPGSYILEPPAGALCRSDVADCLVTATLLRF